MKRSAVDKQSYSKEPDRREWFFPHTRYVSLVRDPSEEGPKSLQTVLETGVANGDCLPACMAAVLECLSVGGIKSRDLKGAAARLRDDLIEYVKERWEKPCLFNMDVSWHDLMALSHDQGITPKEREKYGPWPEDAKGRLARYAARCDELYFCDAEMMAFSEMMHARGLDVVFRTWRRNAHSSERGSLISTTPDPSMVRAINNGCDKMVVVDLVHVGMVDGFNAHYKVLDSGSLVGLTRVFRQWGQDSGGEVSIFANTKRARK